MKVKIFILLFSVTYFYYLYQMENNIVKTSGNEVLVSSKVVADQLEVPHKGLMTTIRKTLSKLDESRVTKNALLFKKSTEINKQKAEYEVYLMNEQAYLLLIMQLSRYKKAFEVQTVIVKAFSDMKQAILNQTNASWLSERTSGKAIRRAETDVIKEFVEYATEQGSEHAKFYYSNITKMTNKALELICAFNGAPIRDITDIQNFGFISVLDTRVKDVLNDGMAQNLPYKYIFKLAKDEVAKFADTLIYKPKLNE